MQPGDCDIESCQHWNRASIRKRSTVSVSNPNDESPGPFESARRDLVWAVESPVLCGSPPPLFAHWAKQPLSEVSIDEELAAHRRIPIGRYFERLIHRWLETREGLSKLACNVPIRSKGATLGEVDLLFAAQDKCYHWELAIKFYLGVGERRAASEWYGPQGRDRLDLKLQKLESQQLRLLERDEGKAVLEELGLGHPESHALLKGYLFHPFAEWADGHRPTPPCVNGAHAHGFWIHQSDVAFLAHRSLRWLCLAKPAWLAPARGPGTIAAHDLGKWLHDYFANDDRPPMIVAMNGRGHEVERGFVVPDDWPPSPK